MGGAIGVNMLGSVQYEAAGADTVAYAILYTLEEGLEMLGVVLFVRALVLYANDVLGGFRTRTGPVV